ncbi:hypothetical protein OHA77_26775 [Streptosporangium sp. NBC_01639]|uniref:hypothetical protein n=1 Tax=Streptosporangium sp. NBC_01639 TaxID=2975948 RepID=UPI003864DD96|nr:hypothetical protein OHA77_26775 [Streptosporangium sp. NBC_01639]
MPRKLKDSRLVMPTVMLGKDAVLLTTLEDLPAFLSFNTRTGHQQVLTTAPKRTSCEECFEVKRAAVNAEQVAWLIQGGRRPDARYDERYLELWTMPRTGGPLRMVTRLPVGGDDYSKGFQVIDDLAIWWGFDGTWSVPLTGGEPKQILPEGTVRVTSWPWGYDRARESVINLVTRQENKAQHLDDIEEPYCGPVWCVGWMTGQPHEAMQVVMQHVDGSKRTTVPGSPLSLTPPIRDRFTLLHPLTVSGDGSGTPVGNSRLFQLYDRCTGQTALLGPDRARAEATSGEIHYGAATPDMSMLFWKDSATRYTVLDVSRIADSPCAG